MASVETDRNQPRSSTQVSQCEPDGAQPVRRSTLIAGVSTQNSSSSALTAACSSLYSKCRPALLVSNAFSKPVHIASSSFSEDSVADFLCVSSTPTEPFIHEEIGPGHKILPHYYMGACTDGQLQDTRSAPSQVEPACAASNTSVAHEAVHVCTQSISDDAGGGNGCINVVTLCSIWRLTTTDTDDTDSTDDLFMIPIEESQIGRHSSLHA